MDIEAKSHQSVVMLGRKGSDSLLILVDFLTYYARSCFEIMNIFDLMPDMQQIPLNLEDGPDGSLDGLSGELFSLELLVE